MVARRSNCMIAACYAMPGPLSRLVAIRPRPLKTLQTSNGNKSEASRFKGALAPPDHIFFTTMSEASELGSKAKGIFVTLASGAATAACWLQYRRAGQDETMIQELFKQRTTVRDLEDLAAAGKPLPQLAVVCGQIRVDEPIAQWGDTAIKQYLLTRLAPSVYSPGRREPKDTRYTVATSRLVAPGLHLVGLTGSEARLRLPRLQADMGQNSPCLFLSQDDAFESFITSEELRNTLAESMSRDLGTTPLALMGKRFRHTSKFVSGDSETSEDFPRDFLMGCHKKLSNLDHPDQAATPLSETYWFWNPRGFYDCHPNDSAPPPWCSFPRCEYVLASEFLRRAEVAASENNEESTMKYKDQDLAEMRDTEFGYRFVELTIPANEDVTVIAKPVVVSDDPNDTRRIQLCEPGRNPTGANFRFGILKGHSVERLLEQRAHHRNFWKRWIYLGSAVTAASAAYTAL